MISPLNKAVPYFQADIPRFPQDPDVQSALQNIILIYMDALLFAMESFSIQPPPSGKSGLLRP